MSKSKDRKDFNKLMKEAEQEVESWPVAKQSREFKEAWLRARGWSTWYNDDYGE